jgi:glycosyltransferase involved in cell wall biosynthesis/Tfp pilus assembly protein PilF
VLIVENSLNKNSTIVWLGPFYNRSGYGVLARATVLAMHRRGYRLRILSVNEIEPGIDDVDMDLVKSLEKTKIIPPVTYIISHVPSKNWLKIPLPEPRLTILATTFDGAAQGNLPPASWFDVFRKVDQVWLHNPLEKELYAREGIPAEKMHIIYFPDAWIDNPVLPTISRDYVSVDKPFRFLSVAMFLPRRRWDTLIEAFLLEFKHEPNVELYFKVNYPQWHPVPGKPQKDLFQLIASLKKKTGSNAKIVVDDELGTRMGMVHLFDSSNAVISTDSVTTGPLAEARIRHRIVIVPKGVMIIRPDYFIAIDNDPNLKMKITPEMQQYMPHHKGKYMQLLKVEDVRKAMRTAFNMTSEERFAMAVRATNSLIGPKEALPVIENALTNGWKYKERENFKRTPIIWEGSQFVYHSLALINRELCLKLIDKGYDISIVPYERHSFGPEVDDRFQKLSARFNKKLYKPADVHVRHQWPPNFTPPSEGHWVIIQPWEFGSLPREWVSHMSASVDEIWVPSHFVRHCFIQSGVPSDRVFVVPNGVDTKLFNRHNAKYKLKTKKKFRFLFVGGTILRKGIDILLNTYTRNFSIKDDVCLVIKDMGGQSFYMGQTAKDFVKRIQSEEGAPEIEYIDPNLSFRELAGLYRACDCLVHPYRGEGFGLPIAEAMASGCPVIVTGYGAALDFCPEDITYLIPAQAVQLANKHIGDMETVDFPWLAEPDEKELARLMRYVMDNREEAAAKGKECAAFIQSNFTWDHAAQSVMSRIRQLKNKPVIRYSQTKVYKSPSTDKERQDTDAAHKMYQNAQMLVEKGMDKAAIMALGKLLESYPEFALAQNDLGVLYYKAGKKEDAFEHYKKAAELQPENINFQKNLADFYYVERGKVQEAMEIYVQILALNPQDIECLLMLGHISVSMEKTDDAKVFYMKVLESDPDNAVARQNLDSIQNYEQGTATVKPL